MKLRAYGNPIIDYRIAKNVLRKAMGPSEERKLLGAIKRGDQARKLLSGRDRDGRIPFHPYAKWFGAHWILTALAEIDYPPGDGDIKGLVDQAYEWLSGFRSGWKVVKGKVRTHPCMLGNALYYLSKLGFADGRADDILAMILETRWPDGGWNCDAKPGASISSITTTRLVLRGLNEYDGRKPTAGIRGIIDGASRLITDRGVFLSRKTGRVIHPYMQELSYPAYYHYTALSALTVLMEIGHKNAGSLDKALDSIEGKELEGGGFPAERKRYAVSDGHGHGSSPAGWGKTGGKTMNEYVTVDALAVLRYYGRA